MSIDIHHSGSDQNQSINHQSINSHDNGKKILKLKEIKDQTPSICLIAVQQDGRNIQHIDPNIPYVIDHSNPLHQHYYDLGWRDWDLRKVLIAGASKYVHALSSIKNASPYVYLAALHLEGLSVRYLINFPPDKSSPDWDELTIDDLYLEAVKQNGYALFYIQDQTPELCQVAVKQNGEALQHVKEQTEAICMMAVQQNGFALEHVKNQTPAICLEAIHNYSLESIQYVKDLESIAHLIDEHFLQAGLKMSPKISDYYRKIVKLKEAKTAYEDLQSKLADLEMNDQDGLNKQGINKRIKI